MPRVVIYPYWCRDCKNIFGLQRPMGEFSNKCPDCGSGDVRQVKDFQP